MKRISYHYTPIKQILTPFDLEYERISLSNDLQKSLATLFPLKSIFFLQKNPGIFSISFLADAPYGPDMNTLIDFLFTDLNKAFSKVKDFFRLKEEHRVNFNSDLAFEIYYDFEKVYTCCVAKKVLTSKYTNITSAKTVFAPCL